MLDRLLGYFRAVKKAAGDDYEVAKKEFETEVHRDLPQGASARKRYIQSQTGVMRVDETAGPNYQPASRIRRVPMLD